MSQNNYENYYENRNSAFQKVKSDTLAEETRTVKEGRSRLLEIAFYKKGWMFASAAFSVINVALSFVPYIILYLVLLEILPNLSNLSQIDVALLMTYVGLIIAAIILTPVTMLIALMCSHYAAFQTLYKLKIDFAAKLETLPLGYFNRNASGKLRKIMDDNIESIELFIAHHFPDLVGSFTAPIVLVALLMYFDWRVGLICLLPVAAAYVIQAVSFGGKNKIVFLKTYQDALEDMNVSSVEYVRGISVIKIFNQTVYSFRQFHDSILNYTKFCIKYTYMCRLPMTAFTTILNNISFFLIPVGIWWVTRTTDYAAFALTFIFYMIFSASLTSPFMKLMYVSNKGDVIIDGIRRMDETFNTPSVKEPSVPVNPAAVAGRSVRFDNVSFSYGADSSAKALDGISFKAEEGQVTALVGKSGSGKSTVSKLIARFWDTSGGRIFVGGIDIKTVDPEHLMEYMSFVFQDVVLFDDTVFNNIKLGRHDATDEEVYAAAKAAHCDDFVSKMTDGYRTVIGENGSQLSGGERQRISIARALLKDAPIVLLDEAMASLDPENEGEVQSAISRLIDSKTVVVIAHRLRTIMYADKIVVLDSGRVVEQGTHDELIRNDSLYARMYGIQKKSMDWSI